MVLSIKFWGTKKKSIKLLTEIYWPGLQTGRSNMYIHVYQVIKNPGPGLYDTMRHTDDV